MFFFFQAEIHSSYSSKRNRAINANNDLLNRFKMEGSKSRANLIRSAAKSGRPGILKPIKLVEAEEKDDMLWIQGNPWEAGNLIKLHNTRQYTTGES